MKLIVMKKGGEPGEVAINPDLVTHVRSMVGPYTDIYFRDHRVAVEGSFQSVVKALSVEPSVSDSEQSKASWIKPVSG